MPQRKYSPEYRDSAVKLVAQEKQPVPKVAADLGVPAQTLYAWVAQARKRTGVFTPPDDRDLQARVRELEAETRRLRSERDILRKATAFFAREPS